MSDLDRLLKLAGREVQQVAQSPAVDREMKEAAPENKKMVCKDCGDEMGHPTSDCENSAYDKDGDHWIEVDIDGDGDADIKVAADMAEAVGDSAELLYDLVDELADQMVDELSSQQLVLDELVRYLDRDTSADFVADFRRHHDMNKGKMSDQPILDLVDEVAQTVADELSSRKLVLDELVRYLDGDTLADFVADFRRHHDMNHDTNEGKETVTTNEAGGYYTQPVYDMIKKHGYEKVMHELLTALDADVIQDALGRMGGMEESRLEVSDEEKEKAMKRAFAKSDEPERGEKRKKVSVSKAPWESLEEDDLDENAFNQAAAAASRAGKSEFEFNGKKYKTKMDKSTAHQLDDDIQFESEELEESSCGCCGNDPCDCASDCGCKTESVNEAPTMDTTQMVIMMKNAGLSEEAIQTKLNEWANSPADASELEQTSHGEAYDFAQNVNLSLKRYLDAQDMKVQVSEHTVENMKALYESKKNK